MRFTSVLASLLLAGCAAPTHSLDPEGPAIRTDRSEYVVRRTGDAITFTMGLTFVNRTDGPVYLPTCHSPHPPVVEKRVDGAWVTVYAPPVLLCAGPPLVVPRGERYEYEYRVHGALPGGDFHPEFRTARVEGTYRLRWGFLEAPPEQAPAPRPIPLEHRISNEFTLRE